MSASQGPHVRAALRRNCLGPMEHASSLGSSSPKDGVEVVFRGRSLDLSLGADHASCGKPNLTPALRCRVPPAESWILVRILFFGIHSASIDGVAQQFA